jgi:hypothetical protein
MDVSNIAELKRAIQERPESITILDESLAKKVRILKSTSAPAVAVLAAAGTVTATMWWNPVGWTAGAAALTVAATVESALVVAVAFLITAMGGALLWALFNDWDIDVSVEGSVKGTAKAALKLRPKAKS